MPNLSGTPAYQTVVRSPIRFVYAVAPTVITYDGTGETILYRAELGDYLGQVSYVIEMQIGAAVVSFAYVTGGPANGYVALDGKVIQTEGDTTGTPDQGADDGDDEGTDPDDDGEGFFPGLGILNIPPIFGLPLALLLLLLFMDND
jgi:hypothetical protein